ncbi:hypothetical protein [Streptomyces sp. NPDC003863]
MNGIRDVGQNPSDGVIACRVPEGRHVVVVHLSAWQAEADSQDEAERPVAGVLPDFVVLIDPAQRGKEAFLTAGVVSGRVSVRGLRHSQTGPEAGFRNSVR